MTLEVLLNSISDYRLLTPLQLEELSASILPFCQEVRVVVSELLYRKWLTEYQWQAILEGRTKKLFLANYTLIEPIGEGAMGKVYLARNWRNNQTYALKLIRDEHTQNELAVKRFRREIKALQKINHPNIIRVHDANTSGDILFFATDYVPGTDFSRILKENGPLPVSRACEVIRQVAEALVHIHEVGLIHRDIKPSNLLLSDSDGRVKLLDLGLARFQLNTMNSGTNLTRLGILIGTPDYIAPEQVQDPRSATIRSDLYSLGCTFYHLLSGAAPFEFQQLVDKLYSQCFRDPKPITEHRGDLPPRLAKLVQRLLEKKPRKRPRHPQQVINEIDAILKQLEPFEAGMTKPLLRNSQIRSFQAVIENSQPRTEQLEKVPLFHLFEPQNVDQHELFELAQKAAK